MQYNFKQFLRDMDLILDEHSTWFLRVVKTVFYPTNSEALSPNQKPETFMQWAQKALDHGLIEAATLKDLQASHSEMTKLAASILEHCVDQATPAYEEFKVMTDSYEHFMNVMRRIEKDSLLEDSSLDFVTGFKLEDSLERDIRREMDRLDRHGKQFCLALLRIDGFADIKFSQPQDVADEYLATAAKIIRKSMRSFDDGYLLDDGHFLLSLKQTATPGAVRAMERIQYELGQEKMTSDDAAIVHNISLSSCIAEPVPNDNIGTLVANLHNDLDGTQREEGTVLEHQEMSPLERFMKSGDH